MFWWETTDIGVLVDGHALGRWHVTVALAAVSFSKDSGDNKEEDDGKCDCKRDEHDKANGELMI